MSSKPPKIIHPFFMSIFPILSLYACNLGEVVLSWLIGPLIIVLIACTILWQVLSRLIANKYRAGIILTGFWFYFFAYGHYRGIFNKLDIDIFHTMPSWPYFVVWTLIFAAGIFLAYRIRTGIENITRILNIMAATVIVMSAVNIALFEVKVAKRSQMIRIDKKLDIPISAGGAQRPNVFYIILDQHARGDILRDYLDYDNDYFHKQLEEQGFWVAQNSYTNYVLTPLSLASSLNFCYLDDAAKSAKQNLDYNFIRKMLKGNETTRLFKQLGYDTVVFSSGFSYSEFRGADVYITEEERLPLNDFIAELVNNTAVRGVINKALGSPMLTYLSHQRRLLNTLDKLPEVMQKDKPVFVFAHILCPHHPYVFDSKGSIEIPDEVFAWGAVNVTSEQRNAAYIAQLEYLDRRIVEVVEKIKQNSPSPPVIIVQADHGPYWALGRGGRKMKPHAAILNAYHLPGFDYANLHDSISPVNTFRVIFNHYFGMDYELLEDKCYFSSYKNMFHFTDITEELSSVSTPTDIR